LLDTGNRVFRGSVNRWKPLYVARTGRLGFMDDAPLVPSATMIKGGRQPKPGLGS
jgi:hypothetical protein